MFKRFITTINLVLILALSLGFPVRALAYIIPTPPPLNIPSPPPLNIPSPPPLLIPTPLPIPIATPLPLVFPSPAPTSAPRPTPTSIPTPTPSPSVASADEATPTPSPSPVAETLSPHTPDAPDTLAAPVTSLNDPLNSFTGADSTNVASLRDITDLLFANRNTAEIFNFLDHLVDTGQNQASRNTGAGQIFTGNAFLGAQVRNTANTNSVTTPEPSPLPLVSQNDTTGSDSTNLTEAEILNNLAVDNTNSFLNTNELTMFANTGQNQASENTGAGQIDTGDAQAVVDLVTSANANFVNSDSAVLDSFSLFGANYGDLDFTELTGGSFAAATSSDGFVESSHTAFDTQSPVLAQNTTTGPDSDNVSVISATASAQILNDNTATVTNDVTVAAVTGQNQASRNTGAGQIDTGDADLAANVVNFLNTNVVESNLLLATINVFGDWIGDLIVPLLTGDSAATGTVITANSSTGAGSTNTAVLDANQNLAIVNSNAADITTDFTTESNTGSNTTDYNTGPGLVTTGQSTNQNSVTTLANQNITGGNPVILIINTLGDWVGGILDDQGNALYQNQGPTTTVYTTLSPDTNFLSGSGTVSDSFVGNSDTGANSTNTSLIDLDNSLEVTNTNSLNLDNNINLLADTGTNDASMNTGGGVITTGDANLAGNVVNIANTNITNSNVLVLVINVFGSWLGNITDLSQSQDTGPLPSPEPAVGGAPAPPATDTNSDFGAGDTGTPDTSASSAPLSPSDLSSPQDQTPTQTQTPPSAPASSGPQSASILGSTAPSAPPPPPADLPEFTSISASGLISGFTTVSRDMAKTIAETASQTHFNWLKYSYLSLLPLFGILFKRYRYLLFTHG